ncbi:MAG TPA: EcsC family protein [Gillisia sp.]|nr:EcsC family protein [Gillisia sp.]
MNTDISNIDMEELQMAKRLLENPGLAARITNYIGMPIEKGFEMLPKNWNEKVVKITHTAIQKSSEAALFTVKDQPGKKTSNGWHKLAVAASGGVGGFFGFAGLAVEIPISTTLMLRSIADIARSQGESISNVDTKLECMQVLALGGESGSDDSTESGYYVTRALLTKSMTEAAEFIAKKGFVEEGAPVLVRFFANISSRFGIQVSEKAAAQAVPIIGAISGAALNTIFIDHFQDMATGHFIVRKLERNYGKEVIEELYRQIPD